MNRLNQNIRSMTSFGVRGGLLRPFARRQKSGDAGAISWAFGAFCAALFLAIVVLAFAGINDDGIAVALRLTGRLSFTLFLPAYVGSAIVGLFGRRFDVLARYGREFGLSFASAQLVHFGLVGWLLWISHGPFFEGVMPFFAIGFVWTYALAISSVGRVHDVIRPSLWRLLRAVGLDYIALIFYVDLVSGPIQAGVKNLVAYLPFSILLMAGVLLRMASIMRRSVTTPRYPISLP